MRLILDTNVWLDWLIFADPRVQPLRDAVALGAASIHATEPMLAEFETVIRRPAFALDAAAIEAAIAFQQATVRRHASAPDCRLPCTDPNDRMFLDLAVSLRIDALLSHDKALLRARRIAQRRFGIRIETPQAWCAAQIAAPPTPL